MLPRFWWSPLLCVGLLACNGQEQEKKPVADPATALAADGDHMVSINAADAPPPPPVVVPAKDREWPELVLENGKAWVSCDTDYSGENGDGAALEALDRKSLDAALEPCKERGLVRVRYAGKINPSFAGLVSRLAVVADAMKIGKRILDLDSSGGQVEAAIVAGDSIGESGWTIWVREGSICHSACVFVLAAGDNRLISGKVGIHRMMRISSTATSRAELNKELHEVYDNVKDYLQRNGVAVGVADLMMTVPNRSLRLLTSDELKQYGLDGTNAVQDDLERIKQMRKCGDDFVRRKDAFLIAFDRECKVEGADLEAVNNCGQTLKEQFGFPDEVCPAESPLSEIDTALLVPRPEATPDPQVPATAPAAAAQLNAPAGQH
ncbi:hypothetical protein IB227_03920 [Stenotrophomonas sp. STM01]|uniref:COG3904 family protein n=1 Tax=Stenotrophomonas sp. STM01 TaxID=2769278 RepID=UPI00177B3835|nr:hypothetical protein [Stenotrophomonas sp. STM01]MBD9534995.1 hypothetical protein [Stenotrophomonas sp. STM01]